MLQNNRELLIVCLAGICLNACVGSLKVVPEEKTTEVFGGQSQTLSVVFQNDGKDAAEATIQVRVLQASSSTVVPVIERPWKKLVVLPGQKVLEQIEIDVPAVKSRTRFIVQWLKAVNHILGKKEFFASPTNILADLRSLIGDEATLGVYDLAGTLKPLLSAQGVSIADLEDVGIADFQGKLAIIGPFETASQSPRDISTRIEKLARRGGAVIWIQPPSDPDTAGARLEPSFQTVQVGSGRIVIVQLYLTANLASDPRAQMNLVSLCRAALHSEPPRLPNDRSRD